MSPDNESCKDCRACSGLKSNIKHLEESDKDQWLEINTMKKWLIGTLTTSFISMVGVLVLLLLKLAKAG